MIFAPTHATRAAGLARLAAFMRNAGPAYSERRNNVEPPGHANVSKLSPWVQKRLVLEEELIASARAHWGFQAAEKFIQESYWRTYWKGWLERRPEAWTRWQAAVPRLRDAMTRERRSAYEAGCAGQTDIACFNAWAQELTSTGWLHNHARMWFASIWIFTLRLPWELGAAFFYEHLLDGDPASNTLSWRWVAGLQTAGKTYLARADNIAKYHGAGYAPSARQLASEAFLLTEEPLRQVALVPRPTSWREAVAQSGSKSIGLWLHPDDLLPEASACTDAPIAAIFAGWPFDFPIQAGWNPKVAAWTRAALADGATRAGRHFNCTTAMEDSPSLTAWAEALANWARSEKLDTVLVHEPTVGPWRDAAQAAELALQEAGVRMICLRRTWDATWWPYATRGYFPFWEAAKRAEAGR